MAGGQVTSRSSSGTTARPRCADGARRAGRAGFDQGAGLTSPENHGFALGNNLGIAECAGDVVVFLNNDTTVRRAGWPRARGPRGPRRARRPAAPALPERHDPVGGRGLPARPGDCPTTSSPGSPPRTRPASSGLRFHALTGAALALRRAGRGGPAWLRPGLHQRHGGRRPVPTAPAALRPATSGS